MWRDKEEKLRGFNNSIGKIIETLKAQVSTLNSNYANIKLDFGEVASVSVGSSTTLDASLASTHKVFATLCTGSTVCDTILWNFASGRLQYYDESGWHRVGLSQSGNTVTTSNLSNAAGWVVRFHKVGVAK